MVRKEHYRDRECGIDFVDALPSVSYILIKTVQSSIKKERDKVEKQLANAIREHTNAFHGNSLFPTSSSKKQILVDEKKAVMEMWKEKMYEAVSFNQLF